MKVATAEQATQDYQRAIQSLKKSLDALESQKKIIEDFLTTVGQSEVDIRRMLLRTANSMVDPGSDTLAEVSRLQLESNNAFGRLRQNLVEICRCVEHTRGVIVSLDAQFQAAQDRSINHPVQG